MYMYTESDYHTQPASGTQPPPFEPPSTCFPTSSPSFLPLPPFTPPPPSLFHMRYPFLPPPPSSFLFLFISFLLPHPYCFLPHPLLLPPSSHPLSTTPFLPLSFSPSMLLRIVPPPATCTRPLLFLFLSRSRVLRICLSSSEHGSFLSSLVSVWFFVFAPSSPLVLAQPSSLPSAAVTWIAHRTHLQQTRLR